MPPMAHALKTLISFYAEVMTEVCTSGDYLALELHAHTDRSISRVIELGVTSAATASSAVGRQRR